MHREEPIKEDHFFTIQSPAEGLYKEKGSKFLAYAYPVNSEADVKLRLEELRKKYHDARHYCYAYRINPEHPKWRANDGGEPSNSAGMPILNQIQSSDLWNVLIVVVRYFGGTKLGVSGLINAYKEAARTALSSATVLEKFLMCRFSISFPYSLMNEVMRLVKEEGVEIIGENMGAEASYHLSVRKGQLENVTTKLKKYHQLKLIKD